MTSHHAANALTPTMLAALLPSADLASAVAAAIRGPNAAFNLFFAKCARDLGAAARAIEECVHCGGRVYCFGHGIYSLDAADFASALPAADVSAFHDAFVPLLQSDDDLVAFGPPGGNVEIERAVFRAKTRGAYTLAFPAEMPIIGSSRIADDQHFASRDRGIGGARYRGSGRCDKQAAP